MIKRIFVLFLIVFSIGISVSAEENVKFNANIMSSFAPRSEIDTIQMKTIKKMDIAGITIPQRSIVTAEVINSQRELRWHKSGFILCKLKNYLVELQLSPIDISDKNIYLLVKRYEKLNKKDVAITATEITLTQAASFFAPGVDVLYYFTKGAIQREKNPNWFKAGVFNAYDNSIFWFQQKGKNINLDEGDDIIAMTIEEEELLELKEKVEKRNLKDDKKLEKKLAKQDKKRIETVVDAVVVNENDIVGKEDLVLDDRLYILDSSNDITIADCVRNITAIVDGIDNYDF